MIEAIFFDQDNTLVNTREVAQGAYKEAIDYLADKLGKDRDILWTEWRKYVDENKNSQDPKIRSMEYSFGQLGANEKEIEEAIKLFENRLKSDIQLMPGVEEFLKNKILGIKYILFTEDYQNQIKIKFEKFGFENKFDLVISHEDTGKMKPDISFCKIAWDKFNLNPYNCVYIGDNYEKDCRIGVENGGKSLVFGQDFTDFRQLGELLKNWQ